MYFRLQSWVIIQKFFLINLGVSIVRSDLKYLSWWNRQKPDCSGKTGWLATLFILGNWTSFRSIFFLVKFSQKFYSNSCKFLNYLQKLSKISEKFFHISRNWKFSQYFTKILWHISLFINCKFFQKFLITPKLGSWFSRSKNVKFSQKFFNLFKSF